MAQSFQLPEGARGRGLAVMLAVLAVALVWLGGVAPLAEILAEGRQRIEDKRMLLARMSALASQPQRQRAQDALVAGGGQAGLLLGGASDAVAAAELQGLIQEMAGRSGVRLISVESLAPEARAGYRRIALRVAAEGRYPGVLDLLGGIAAAVPAMLVDGLALRGPGGTAHTDDPSVALSFTVIGLRAGDGGTP